MSKTTLGFIFSGMIYLLIGVTLGVLFFLIPETRMLRTVHAHLNLVGFVVFIIFGIAYHILPRFKGRPLYSESLAWRQFLLSNIGLAGLLISMSIRAYNPMPGLQYAEGAFGIILAVSIYLFIYNMLKTLIPGTEVTK